MAGVLDRGSALEETAETLRAIRNGEVDAVVVRGPDGECIYTLRTIEPPCRAMVEEMAEGVVVLSPDRVVTYANPAFVRMAGESNVVGERVQRFFAPDDVSLLEAALATRSRFDARVGQTPVSVSVKQVEHETGDVVCLVISDMSVHLERSRQIAELTHELTVAEQRERQRLAHTLHDHLQQLIVGVRMQLAAARRGQSADQAFNTADRLLDEAQRTCRDLTMDLSPPVLHQGDPEAALRWLAAQVHQKHGLEVVVECTRDAVGMAEAARVILFAAARELLFNVVKHAGVQQASLRLLRRDQMLVLEVGDEGVGMDPAALSAARDGFGLATLRERIARFGGAFHIDSTPGRGTRASVHLPRVA